jgi:hypothetical protein
VATVIGNSVIVAVNITTSTTTTTINNKFWEELIACFPFVLILIPDTVSRKKNFISMRNEVNKTA